MCEQKRVMAIYDVRGIQNYIFHTTKKKDAIGASAIVEEIIEEALKYACNTDNSELDEFKSENKEISQLLTSKIKSLVWFNENGIIEYKDINADIQVLYIGGGNAVVMYSSEDLCKLINKKMSFYIIKNTYSLQLAVAYVEVGKSYSKDYENLYKKLAVVKANMEETKPLGALPIMNMEIKTGYAIVDKNIDGENVSTDTFLKKTKEKRKKMESHLKKLESYDTKKGIDSTLAVVHIDGNNMGLRIRNLIQGVEDYTEAVNRMREISYRINTSYKKVFNQMEEMFNNKDLLLLKVLTAGDDITYICNGKAALASVEYYVREISKYAMYGNDKDVQNLKDYGFSVCAGIAYINSHFPFSVAYEVAESCCESAKDKAKQDSNKRGDRIGNWIDFHLCKNIHALDLETLRINEYKTKTGENLLIRPYVIPVKDLWEININEVNSFEQFKTNMDVFRNGGINNNVLPRSHAKNIRNTYSQGKVAIAQLETFLKSRNWEMPNHNNDDYEMYVSINNEETAKWYDALEMMDYYIPLTEIGKDYTKEENHE